MWAFRDACINNLEKKGLEYIEHLLRLENSLYNHNDGETEVSKQRKIWSVGRIDNQNNSRTIGTFYTYSRRIFIEIVRPSIRLGLGSSTTSLNNESDTLSLI